MHACSRSIRHVPDTTSTCMYLLARVAVVQRISRNKVGYDVVGH